MKKLCVLLSLLLLLPVFVSCDSTIIVSYKDGHLVDKKHNLAYNPAPLNYEPVSVGEEFAYYKKADIKLYEIIGLEPEKWLTEAYAGSATTIFYSDGEILPTLREMEPRAVHICVSSNRTMSIATIRDAEIIDKLIDLYENGESSEYPLVGSTLTCELKFESALYPCIYYNIIYAIFPEGKFLYDRQTKRAVEIGDLLDKWVNV